MMSCALFVSSADSTASRRDTATSQFLGGGVRKAHGARREARSEKQKLEIGKAEIEEQR